MGGEVLAHRTSPISPGLQCAGEAMEDRISFSHVMRTITKLSPH
jgi:hypothetical protein